MNELYEWLRADAKNTDKIPKDFPWRILQLLKDTDKRITELESRQAPESYNEVDEEEDGST